MKKIRTNLKIIKKTDIQLRVKDYKYQFQIMMMHESLKILGIMMDIAMDTLLNSSIFLLYVNQYRDALKMMFEQKYLHQNDVFLFNNFSIASKYSLPKAKWTMVHYLILKI